MKKIVALLPWPAEAVQLAEIKNCWQRIQVLVFLGRRHGMSAREALITLVLGLCMSSVGLANSGAFPLAETPHWVAVSLQLPRPVNPLVVPWEMHRLHAEHCPEETCYFITGMSVETVYRDLARLMHAREHRLVMELPGELQMWHASPRPVFMIFLLEGFDNGVVLRVLD